jgi:hypothetical protein
MNKTADSFKTSVNLVLPRANRSGYYNTFPASITLGDKKIDGTHYKVVIDAGYGSQETFNVYKDDNCKWVVYPLEDEPIIHDEIRKEIDKIENL